MKARRRYFIGPFNAHAQDWFVAGMACGFAYCYLLYLASRF